MALLAVNFSNSWSQSYQKTDTGIKTLINSVEVEIQFYSPSMVRVLKWPEGNTIQKKSLSIIKTPQKTSFRIKQSGDELSLKSDILQVVLNLKNGKISYSTLKGEEIILKSE